MMLLGGRERIAADFDALLSQTGWRLERIVPADGPADVITASAA